MLQGVHTVTFEIQCDVIEDKMDEWLQVHVHVYYYYMAVIGRKHTLFLSLCDHF